MCALSAKAHEGRLLLVDSLQPDFPKTKALATQLRQLLVSSGVVREPPAKVEAPQRQAPKAPAAKAAAPGDEDGKGSEAADAAGNAAGGAADGAAGGRRRGQQTKVKWNLERRTIDINALLVDAAKHGADGGVMLRRAGGNLPQVDIVPQIGANVYGILRRDVLVMTKAAAEALTERLLAPVNRLGASGRTYQQRMQQRAEERQRTAAAELQQLPYTQRPLPRSAPLFSEGDRQQLLQTR
jgi:hypothetical protein